MRCPSNILFPSYDNTIPFELRNILQRTIAVKNPLGKYAWNSSKQ